MREIPGFIDLQVNGYLQVDFSDSTLTDEQFAYAASKLLDTGCAAFLPTVITSSPETYRHNFAIIAKAMRRPEFAGRILGIHAEGPFISDRPGAVGAHTPAFVRRPDPDFLRQMQEWAEGNIRILTIAAENPGAVELTRCAVEMGIVVSLGHQLANREQLIACRDAGATWQTHLGNGMPNEVDRHRNPLLDGLEVDGLSAGIIADGHHLPPDLVKIMLRVKGIDHAVIVSDASSLAGMPPGRYHSMGNDVVIEPNGYLHNPAKRCLVGSSATITGCVKVLCTIAELTPEDIVRLTFDNPLRLIGVDPATIKTPFICRWNETTHGFDVIRS